MSQMPPGQTPPGMGAAGGQQQPSEEEMRAALSQMRGAPAVQIVAEVQSALLNAAQVKLGRNDGRLLLDLAGMVNDHTRGLVDEQLTQQVDQAMQQLRVAQVEGEQEVIAAAQEGHSETNDLSRRPPEPGAPRDAAPAPDADGVATPADGADPGQQPPSGDGGQAASRLWVPGR